MAQHRTQDELDQEADRLVESIEHITDHTPRPDRRAYIKHVADAVYESLLRAGPEQWVRMARPSSHHDLQDIRERLSRHLARQLPNKDATVVVSKDQEFVYFGLKDRAEQPRGRRSKS